MIELSSPLFLPALALLPGAVTLLYLIRRRRARLLHPTLMFLDRAETVLDASRLHPRLAASLLFLLDLLIASLLALALCRPAIPQRIEGAATTLLLLDTSASLSARAGDGRAFDRVKRRAGERIAGMGRGDETALLTLDRRLHVACPPTGDKARLLAALAGLEPSETPLALDDAPEARRLLNRGTLEAAVLFLTDGALPAGCDTQAFADRTECFPAPFRNVGIVSLDAARAADPADGFDVTLRLASTDASTREVDLELYGDGELVDMRRVAAGPGLSSHRLETVRMKPGLLCAWHPAGDDLPADDRAYALAAPDGLHFHRLDTTDPVLLSLFSALPDFSAAPGATGAVFVTSRPDEIPPAALARMVFEGAEGAPRPVANLLAPETDPDHPVTAGLDPAEFLIGEGRFLDPPEGARILLGTGDACVAWIGPHAGRMTAWFGFLPERTNGARRSFLPLLLSRAARHVASYHARVEATGRTGDPFVLRGAGAGTRIVAPDGATHLFPRGGEIFFIHTGRAGAYRVDGPEGSLLVPLNLHSPEESLTPPRDATAGQLPEARATRAAPRDLTAAVASLALLLLVVEWAVLRRSL